MSIDNNLREVMGHSHALFSDRARLAVDVLVAEAQAEDASRASRKAAREVRVNFGHSCDESWCVHLLFTPLCHLFFLVRSRGYLYAGCFVLLCVLCCLCVIVWC